MIILANEFVLQLKIDEPLPFTVDDATAIAKGELLKMTTDRTAIISSGINNVIAGFAAREKVADDGRTELAVFRKAWALV